MTGGPRGGPSPSATPRGGAAGLAFQAGAVAHEGEVRAFGAGFADIALGLGLGALHRLRLAHRFAGMRQGRVERERTLPLGLRRGLIMSLRLGEPAFQRIRSFDRVEMRAAPLAIRAVRRLHHALRAPAREPFRDEG